MSAETPRETPRWRGENLVTRACAVVVAGVAAYSSYGHQRDFALDGGADPVSAAVWPLSVDGLVILASLGLLRPRAETSRRARCAVWFAFLLGVVVSLAANIAAAPELSWQPVVVAGWPPLALLLATELIVHSRRRRRTETGSTIEIETSGAGPGDARVSASGEIGWRDTETAGRVETAGRSRGLGLVVETGRENAAETHRGDHDVNETQLAETQLAENAMVSHPEPADPGPAGEGDDGGRRSRSSSAEDLMWGYYQRASAGGRVPSGAELDRVAGTSNYGRRVIARWRDSGRLPPAA